MSYTKEKLEYLDATKALIRQAIENKGQTVSDTDTFRSYADKILAIETGTKETVLEGLEFDLDLVDFSSGEASFNAGDGYLIKSAVIQKPDALIPENIASGVTICGIEGTLEAGGGGSQENGEIFTMNKEYIRSNYGNIRFELNGVRWVLMKTASSTSSYVYELYKFVNGVWELHKSVTMTDCNNVTGFGWAEYDGKMHFCHSSWKKHFVFDGTDMKMLSDTPYYCKHLGAVNGCLYLFDDITRYYKWNADTDTWETVNTSCPNIDCAFSHKGKVYLGTVAGLQTFDGSAFEVVKVFDFNFRKNGGRMASLGDYIYFFHTPSEDFMHLYKYNPDTDELCDVGYLMNGFIYFYVANGKLYGYNNTSGMYNMEITIHENE